MITTGIIREININSKNYKHNKYKVELNIFQVPGDTDKSNYTFEANCMVASGFSSVYNIGDKVYVSFLNNDKSYPIILGKIYQGLTDEYRGYGALTDLKVKTSARLPNDTHIGQYTYQDFDLAFKKLSTLGIESINSIVTLLEKTPVTTEQLTSVNEAVTELDAKLTTVTSDMTKVSSSLQNLQDDIAKLDSTVIGFSITINNKLAEAENKIETSINEAKADAQTTITKALQEANAEIEKSINAVGEKLADLDETGVVDHVIATDNPHQVTKSQIGLEYVDNTADENKPVSTAQRQAIDEAIDTIRGTDLDIAGADTIYGANKAANNAKNAADAAQNDATQALADAKKANDAIAIINGAETQAGSIAKALVDAKIYTDTREVEINKYADKAEEDAVTTAKGYIDGLVNTINEAATALKSVVDTHVASEANPHKVTAEQVGVSAFENKTFNDIKTEFTGAIEADNEGFVTGDAVFDYIESKNLIKDIYFEINGSMYTCKEGATWADFSAIRSNSICQCLNNFVMNSDLTSAIYYNIDDNRSIYVKSSDYILENKKYNFCDAKQLNIYTPKLNDDGWSFSENPSLQIIIPNGITWDDLATQLDDSTTINKKGCFISLDNLVYVHIFDGNLSTYKFVKVSTAASGELTVAEFDGEYKGELYKDSISANNYAVIPYNWDFTNSSN